MGKNKYALPVAIVFAVALALGWFFLKRSSSDNADAPPRSSHEASQVVRPNSPTAQAPAETLPPIAPLNLAAQQGRLNVDEEGLRKWLSGKDPKAQWKILKTQDGKITSIMGGFINASINSKDKKQSHQQALALAREFAPYLGVAADTLASAEARSVDNPRLADFHVTQVFDGYPVYGSDLDLLARTNDGAVYMINNTLIPIDSLDKRISFAATDAALTESLQTFFSQLHESYQIVSIRPTTYAFANGHGTAELGYEATVRVFKPELDQLLVLMSAYTGQVVSVKSQMMDHHN